MIEILATTNVDGSEEPTMATLKNGKSAILMFMLLPGKAEDDFSFCGHTQCWNAMATPIEMSLN